MINGNAKASERSIARCRFGGGNGSRAFAGVAGVAGVAFLGWLVAGANLGCDEGARIGAGTGGTTGTGTGGAAAETGGMTGTGGSGGMGGDTGGTTGSDTGGSGGGACGPQLGVTSRANEGAMHQVACTAVSYMTNPPSSGSHYPVWPAYKTYAQPVPWGFLMHGLEHGAIAVVYNCPAGCPTEVAAAQAWIDGLPSDATCGGARPRVILAPDPMLDVRWAAAAWTWTLRTCTFDQAMFQQFFADHYDRAPEIICDSGADQSATGWCP